MPDCFHSPSIRHFQYIIDNKWRHPFSLLYQADTVNTRHDRWRALTPRRSLQSLQLQKTLKSNTHRRRRDSSVVELSRVGGVNAPVGSRDPVYNFLCCWAIEVGDNDIWRHCWKKYQSIKIHVEPLWSVPKLSTESIGSRRELVANSVYTADATQLNSTVESRRRCVFGISKCNVSTLMVTGHVRQIQEWTRRQYYRFFIRLLHWTVLRRPDLTFQAG